MVAAWVRRAGTLIVGVALVSCASSGSTATGPPSKSRLQGMLLSVRDVGGTWQAGQPINEQDLAAFAQAPCESVTIDPAVVKRLTAVTGVQFEPAQKAYQHLIELVTTGGSAQLDKDLTAVVTAVQACSKESPGLTVTALSVPDLGDQQAAYAVTQARPGTSNRISVRIGYVRLGSVAFALGLTDFQADARGVSRISDDAFLVLLQKAFVNLKPATLPKGEQ